MLMTEEQARTKWCPHARQTGVTNRDGGMCATANRAGSEHYGVENCNCIASGCMAWRWVRVRDDEGSEDGGAAILTQTYGFCGAFGKPEAA
ncbi:hypothetical protein Sp245p_25945 (plasmid) [Azospirillum baldaniorum]|uniref:Uncharacterized protein n=1 Tax=Azospirillum baldaniorum TaxID=1064539 RepID=A0A9P1JZT0_9PROT|nr:hypothetical protein [Azospirillum baldaniorum]AWJ93269.1 hypothetical protein Sp245p_25945 [Azospirillum baldaniorum]TWA77964.1 hypothetical protein FBZ85_106124 [Azospirillum brasilense]CCD02936.1 conserved protein of unknown function [Azospirillum baldaniorum]